jgi:hypothetical protein
VKAGASVCGWRAMPCSVRRRSSVPRGAGLVAARRTGSTGSGSAFGEFLGQRTRPAVMVSKSACCRRSRSEKLNSVSNCSLFLRRLAGLSVAAFGAGAARQRFGHAVVARRATASRRGR